MFLNFLKNLFGSSAVDKTVLKQDIAAGAFVVDVRTPAEFNSGHAANSINIPLQEIAKHLAKFKGKNKIILVCRSGARAGQAKDFLTQQGFTNIVNAGGWQNVNV
jgi:phage shock protein E